MDLVLDKDLNFEFGSSKRHLTFTIAISLCIMAFGLYWMSVGDLFVSEKKQEPFFSNAFLIGLGGFLMFVTAFQDLWNAGLRLINYNEKIRNIFLNAENVRLPKSYKAEDLTKIDWEAIEKVWIEKYYVGWRYFIFGEKGRKLYIKTKDDVVLLQQNDLTDKADFKPLCLTIAKRANCEFEYV